MPSTLRRHPRLRPVDQHPGGRHRVTRREVGRRRNSYRPSRGHQAHHTRQAQSSEASQGSRRLNDLIDPGPSTDPRFTWNVERQLIEGRPGQGSGLAPRLRSGLRAVQPTPVGPSSKTTTRTSRTVAIQRDQSATVCDRRSRHHHERTEPSLRNTGNDMTGGRRGTVLTDTASSEVE